MASGVLVPALRPSLINPVNGLLAVGFTVTFYHPDKTTLKEVYDAPNLTNQLANPYTLDSVATHKDFYVSDADDTWIVIKDTGETIRYNYTAYTGAAGSSQKGTVAENYIENGQFMQHFDLPKSGNYIAGEIREDDTVLAFGGWHFVRADGSSSKDIITYQRYTDPDESEGNPRYAARIANTNAGSGYTRKDLEHRWSNVRRFDSDTQKYTLAFWAKTNGSSEQVSIYKIKNYGTGGDTTDKNLISGATFTITNTFKQFVISFVFDDSSAKNVGSLDDDFVALAWRMPLASTYDIEIRSAILYEGEFAAPIFPVTLDRHQLALSAFPNDNPVYDGSDLYLPNMKTKNGYVPDYSLVGQIFGYPYDITTHDDSPYLKGNGDSYLYSEYSDLGIPYKRLADRLWIDSIKAFTFGTGYQFFTASRDSNDLLIANNSVGTVTPAGAGTSGFSVDAVHTSTSDGYYVRTWMSDTSKFNVQNSEAGIVNANPSDSGSSGFTFKILNEAISRPYGKDANLDNIPEAENSTTSRQLFEVTAPAGSTLANAGNPGKYWQFDSVSGATVKEWVVWYQLTTETAPTVGSRTPIQVNVTSTDTSEQVALKTCFALRGVEVSLITCTAASSITAGAYFTINTYVPVNYYVWYKKDGSGTDPALSGKTGIVVSISGGDSASTVVDKTMEAINKFMVGMPDMRGVFLRGFDDGRGLDLDSALRYSMLPNYRGDKIGTMQYDQILKHGHWFGRFRDGGSSPSAHREVNGDTTGSPTYYPTSNEDDINGKESRPVNMSLLYVIRY